MPQPTSSTLAGMSVLENSSIFSVKSVLGLDEVLATVEGALALALGVPAQVDVLAPVVLEHALVSSEWWVVSGEYTQCVIGSSE